MRGLNPTAMPSTRTDGPVRELHFPTRGGTSHGLRIRVPVLLNALSHPDSSIQIVYSGRLSHPGSSQIRMERSSVPQWLQGVNVWTAPTTGANNVFTHTLTLTRAQLQQAIASTGHSDITLGATPSNAQLTITDIRINEILPRLPVITRHAHNTTVTEGAAATFQIRATGIAPLTFQWQRLTGGAWADIPGATSGTLTLPNVAYTLSGSQYRVVVTNPNGYTTSNTAQLTVNPALPVITQNPQGITVNEGYSATFRVAATGTAQLTFQWQQLLNGAWTNIPGATSDTLTLTDVAHSLNGRQYRAVVFNSTRSRNSNPAVLSVVPAPIPGDGAENAEGLSRFENSHSTSQYIVRGATLPGENGFYFRLRQEYVESLALRNNTNITLISPHEGLRFRVYDETLYNTQGRAAAIVFDSHYDMVGPVNNRRSADRGRIFSVSAWSRVFDGYVQKVNANGLTSRPRWVANRSYFIVVYVHPSFANSTTPVGNSTEFWLAVGEGIRVGSPGAGTTWDIMSVSGIAHSPTPPNRMRTSGITGDGRHFTTWREANSRPHPNTARVESVWLSNQAQPSWANWNMTLENLDYSGSRMTRSGNRFDTGTFVYSQRPLLSGRWHIVIEATNSLSSTIPPRPALTFRYSWEIGD